MTWVSFLRGVNVGGKNLLPMKKLLVSLDTNGFRDANTYIQSGNIIFNSDMEDDKSIERAVAKLIEADFNLTVPVVSRNSAEIVQLIEQNPFTELEQGATLHVYLLQELPDPDLVKRIDPARSPQDQLAIRGKTIYLMAGKNYSDSKFTNDYLDSSLNTVSTSRNWRTMLAIQEKLQKYLR